MIARNADQPNSRWYSGAGLYRPVQLWTAGDKHILLNGVRIRTVSLEPAVVEIRVRTSVFTLTIDNARLWTPETPNLYRCRVQFADDEAVETFGVRTVSWGKNGFTLNGERVIIQGACIHHDNGLLGAVCDPGRV